MNSNNLNTVTDVAPGARSTAPAVGSAPLFSPLVTTVAFPQANASEASRGQNSPSSKTSLSNRVTPSTSTSSLSSTREAEGTGRPFRDLVVAELELSSKTIAAEPPGRELPLLGQGMRDREQLDADGVGPVGGFGELFAELETNPINMDSVFGLAARDSNHPWRSAKADFVRGVITIQVGSETFQGAGTDEDPVKLRQLELGLRAAARSLQKTHRGMSAAAAEKVARSLIELTMQGSMSTGFIVANRMGDLATDGSEWMILDGSSMKGRSVLLNGAESPGEASQFKQAYLIIEPDGRALVKTEHTTAIYHESSGEVLLLDAISKVRLPTDQVVEVPEHLKGEFELYGRRGQLQNAASEIAPVEAEVPKPKRIALIAATVLLALGIAALIGAVVALAISSPMWVIGGCITASLGLIVGCAFCLWRDWVKYPPNNAAVQEAPEAHDAEEVSSSVSDELDLESDMILENAPPEFAREREEYLQLYSNFETEQERLATDITERGGERGCVSLSGLDRAYRDAADYRAQATTDCGPKPDRFIQDVPRIGQTIDALMLIKPLVEQLSERQPDRDDKKVILLLASACHTAIEACRGIEHRGIRDALHLLIKDQEAVVVWAIEERLLPIFEEELHHAHQHQDSLDEIVSGQIRPVEGESPRIELDRAMKRVLRWQDPLQKVDELAQLLGSPRRESMVISLNRIHDLAEGYKRQKLEARNLGIRLAELQASGTGWLGNDTSTPSVVDVEGALKTVQTMQRLLTAVNLLSDLDVEADPGSCSATIDGLKAMEQIAKALSSYQRFVSYQDKSKGVAETLSEMETAFAEAQQHISSLPKEAKTQFAPWIKALAEALKVIARLEPLEKSVRDVEERVGYLSYGGMPAWSLLADAQLKATEELSKLKQMKWDALGRMAWGELERAGWSGLELALREKISHCVEQGQEKLGQLTHFWDVELQRIEQSSVQLFQSPVTLYGETDISTLMEMGLQEGELPELELPSLQPLPQDHEERYEELCEFRTLLEYMQGEASESSNKRLFQGLLVRLDGLAEHYRAHFQAQKDLATVERWLRPSKKEVDGSASWLGWAATRALGQLSFMENPLLRCRRAHEAEAREAIERLTRLSRALGSAPQSLPSLERHYPEFGPKDRYTLEMPEFSLKRCGDNCFENEQVLVAHDIDREELISAPRPSSLADLRDIAEGSEFADLARTWVRNEVTVQYTRDNRAAMQQQNLQTCQATALAMLNADCATASNIPVQDLFQGALNREGAPHRRCTRALRSCWRRFERYSRGLGICRPGQNTGSE